jgi:hypothetical protein
MPDGNKGAATAAAKKAGPAAPLPPLDLSIYPPKTDAERDVLLRFAREAPFTYGTWSQFKGMYKAVGADPNADARLLGALLARVDDAPLSLGDKDPTIALGEGRNQDSIGVVGDHLVVLRWSYDRGDRKLLVFRNDVNNLLKPVRVGSADLPVGIQNVTGPVQAGGIVGLVTMSRSDGILLRTADISDPSAPRLRGALVFSGTVFPHGGVPSRAHSYLYLAGAGQPRTPYPGLRVVDVTNPDAPAVVGQVEIKGLTGEYATLSVDGRLAALAVKPIGFSWRSLPHDGGLRLVDVADPTAPRVVGSLDLGALLCVALRGWFAYVAIGSDVADRAGLQVVDVADPGRPRKAGFLPLNGLIWTMALSADGQYLYARTQRGTIHTVDVRDAATPRLVGTIERMHGGATIVVSKDLAYIPRSWHGAAILSLARPEAPGRIGTPPSPETVGYMKRRDRRLLRGLAKRDSARYAETAAEMLLAFAGKDAAIDPERHWAAIDVLFGGGSRFRQTKHGRGRYIIAAGKNRPSLRIRTREERTPAAWDARPDLLARLLSAAALPVPVYAFAVRALRATGQPLPTLNDAVLERWLAAEDPLLAVLAIRAVAARLLAGDAGIRPALAADAFFKSGATLRRRLADERGAAWASKRSWAEPFALRLAALVTPAAAELRLSRRQRDGAALLARYFAWAIVQRADAVLPLAAAFLAAGGAELSALIGAAAERATPETLISWLVQVARVSEPEAREPALRALATSLRGVALLRPLVRQLIYHTDPLVRAGGWRMIAAAAVEDGILQAVWAELLQSPQATPALATAMASADALGLLPRAGIGPAALAEHVAARPFLVGLLTPEAFASVAATAPASVVLSLIAAAPDDHWARLRPRWLRQLREGIGADALWLAAEAALTADATGRLEARLLGDLEIAETLLSVEDERLLDIREPAFGAILGGWVLRHAARFARGSALLLDAATHPLPEIRTPSLARVRELGMDMPFALRLMESSVPPSIDLGRTLFEGEPAGGDRERDYALALCDSPVADVRAFGQVYVSARWATLPRERTLLALFENPAPEMQAFVAALVPDVPTAPNAATATFDAEVLRSTNRARVAKERIKRRQSAEPTVDTATLLTLARGRTPRDAEWALGELARRAARGEAIDGMTVEGVIGV